MHRLVLPKEELLGYGKKARLAVTLSVDGRLVKVWEPAVVKTGKRDKFLEFVLVPLQPNGNR